MTVGEFIEYVKKHNIPKDYEILIGYDDDSDYGYGYHKTSTLYIEEVCNSEKTITINTNLTVH